MINFIKYAKYLSIVSALLCGAAIGLLIKYGCKQYFDMYCNNLDKVLLLVILVNAICILLSKEKK